MSIKTFCIKFLKNISKYLPRPIIFSFKLTRKEQLLFLWFIKRSKHYLEFGMGGSTIAALIKSNANIDTVESSVDWSKQMLSYYIIKKAILKKRLLIHIVDIGKITSWGYPEDASNQENFPAYSKEVFSKIEIDSVDTVFIDGRFRVACILKSIENLNQDIVIMVHDFWQRTDYHIVLKYLDVIERADTLAVFKKKAFLNWQELRNDYEKFKYTTS